MSSGKNGTTATHPTSAALFALAWESLVDMLGSATAATLMRRAAARALVRVPELAELTVVREQLEYRCVLPARWAEGPAQQGLRELFVELRVLLVELTGPVVVDRMRTMPGLDQSGLFATESAT